jgi:hypothetical protein
VVALPVPLAEVGPEGVAVADPDDPAVELVVIDELALVVPFAKMAQICGGIAANAGISLTLVSILPRTEGSIYNLLERSVVEQVEFFKQPGIIVDNLPPFAQ